MSSSVKGRWYILDDKCVKKAHEHNRRVDIYRRMCKYVMNVKSKKSQSRREGSNYEEIIRRN